MVKQPKPRPEPPFACWHRGENEMRIDVLAQEPCWGEGEEFVDMEQEERWHAVVRQLERGTDASALVDFLQDEATISPKLRKIIARLWRGEPFHGPDGCPRHIEGLEVRQRRAPPFDPHRLEKRRKAQKHAFGLLRQGVTRDKAIKEAAKACGVTPAEVRAVVHQQEILDAAEIAEVALEQGAARDEAIQKAAESFFKMTEAEVSAVVHRHAILEAFEHAATAMKRGVARDEAIQEAIQENAESFFKVTEAEVRDFLENCRWLCEK